MENVQAANNMSVDAMARLRGMMPSLSRSERKIGEYIVKNHQKVLQMTLAEVASQSGVSDATAVRFFRSLGYKRWLDFKIALSMTNPQSSQAIHDAIKPTDSAGEITRKVIENSINALHDTYAVLDHTEFKKAIGLIEKARRVLIIGVGTSGPMAQEMFNRLFRLGINCSVETDSYLQVMQSALLTGDDLLITISQTGDSSFPIRTTSVARERGCPVISITGNKLSGLAKISDIVLLSVSHETLQETIASRIAQYALIHAIYINLAINSIDQTYRNERTIWDALMSNSFSNLT